MPRHWRTVFRNKHKRVQVLPGQSPPARTRSAPRSGNPSRGAQGGMNLGQSLSLGWQLLVFLAGVYVWYVMWEYLLVSLALAVFLFLVSVMRT